MSYLKQRVKSEDPEDEEEYLVETIESDLSGCSSPDPLANPSPQKSEGRLSNTLPSSPLLQHSAEMSERRYFRASGTIRSTKIQINHLCQYMLTHKEFAAGGVRSTIGIVKHNAEWRKLKKALDELGPARSVNQWKICWRDQKRKARAKRKHAGTVKKSSNGMSNPVSDEDISEKIVLLLDSDGREITPGCGPEESPIGSSQDTMLHPETKPSTLNLVRPIQRPAPAPRQRDRRKLPHQGFLNAQLELNNLIKDLIKEVRRSNELREEHLKLLRGAPEEESD